VLLRPSASAWATVSDYVFLPTTRCFPSTSVHVLLTGVRATRSPVSLDTLTTAATAMPRSCCQTRPEFRPCDCGAGQPSRAGPRRSRTRLRTTRLDSWAFSLAALKEGTEVINQPTIPCGIDIPRRRRGNITGPLAGPREFPEDTLDAHSLDAVARYFKASPPTPSRDDNASGSRPISLWLTDNLHRQTR